MGATVTEPVIHMVAMRDGVRIAVAVYKQPGVVAPALLAASPYRFDNNVLPDGPQFLWRETGPIDFYVAQGYAYVAMDLRGCGRSEGEFEFLGPDEIEDICEIVTWLSEQDWCNGRVGGIGQSYFCMTQWLVGARNPRGLACLAAHDGMNDPYRASVYQGGIPGDFFPGYWWHQNRVINRVPANGQHPREQATDLGRLIGEHPTYDDFWRARTAFERLEEIRVPVFCSGVWAKHQLHTRGAIEGFARVAGPKRLRMSGAPNAWAANAEYGSDSFHRDVLLPFFDLYLKGIDTGWERGPAVQYQVRGAQLMRTAESWPPAGVSMRALYLSAEASGGVVSLNDGTLADAPAGGAESTQYRYPVEGCTAGVVGMGPNGMLDPARRVITFSTPPLAADLEIAGPIHLVLYAASSREDTDFFVKLMDGPGAPAGAVNPPAECVSRGWLRASHRALDGARSTEHVPYHTHSAPSPIVPGEVVRYDISIEPQAYRFAAGRRIRLELAVGDSPVTEALWGHLYEPNKIGVDTFFHADGRQSVLYLPVMSG